MGVISTLNDELKVCRFFGLKSETKAVTGRDLKQSVGLID